MKSLKRVTRYEAAKYDQRAKWVDIIEAIVLADGKSASLAMPWCEIQVMGEHLMEISAGTS